VVAVALCLGVRPWCIHAFLYILPSRNFPVSLWLNSGIIWLKMSMRSVRDQEPAERSERMRVSKCSSLA
jgi:hypothetical protein